MAIAPVISVDYVSDGVTTDYVIPFTYQNDDDIEVTSDGLAVAFTIHPTLDVVQLAVAAPNGAILRVYRNTDVTTMPYSFVLGAPFTKEYIDNNNNVLLQGIQENADGVSRVSELIDLAIQDIEVDVEVTNSVRAPSGEVLNVLPGPTSRANKALGFDASGQPIVYVPSSAGDVTFENLTANGDVGTGADQVAVGNHTHTKSDITDFNDADYATATQGALADSALQPGDNVSDLTNDANYATVSDIDTALGNLLAEVDDLNAVVMTNPSGDLETFPNLIYYNPGFTRLTITSPTLTVGTDLDTVLARGDWTFVSGGSLTIEDSLDLSGILSTDITPPPDGMNLTTTPLAAHSNVSAAAPSNGQVLGWNGSTWLPVNQSGGVTDHGALTGLGDDDHTQYYNQARGDARYVRIGAGLTAGRVPYLSASNVLSGDAGLTYVANTDTLSATNISVSSAVMTSARFGGGAAITYASQGTWTPTFTGASGGAVGYFLRTGKWVRFGNTVWVECVINWNSVIIQPSGQLRVTGLPFISDLVYGNPIAAAGLGATYNTVYIETATGGTHLNINQSTGNTAAVINGGSVATSGLLRFILAYTVA